MMLYDALPAHAFMQGCRSHISRSLGGCVNSQNHLSGLGEVRRSANVQVVPDIAQVDRTLRIKPLLISHVLMRVERMGENQGAIMSLWNISN
jgi:hypothetical protein